MKKTLVSSLIVLCASAGMLLVAGPDDEILQAEKHWAASVMALDYAALEEIYSDDLIYAHSTGAIESKGLYLGRLKGGAQKYDLIEHQKTTIKTFGDSAVAHSIVRMKGLSNSEPFDNNLMMIHVWVKQGGAWKLAAHQTTRLAP